MAPTKILAIVLVAATLAPACKKTPKGDTAQPPATTCEDPDPTWDRGQWLSMAALPDGSPIVAFYNRTKGALEVGTADVSANPVTWCYEQVDGFADESGLDTGNRGAYTSIAVDPTGAGTVWVAYQDINNGTLRYARRTSSLDPNAGLGDSLTKVTWETGVADVGGGAPPESGLWASLALDPSGNPVIAHYDKEKGELRVAHWGDMAFTGEVVDAGTDATDATGATIEANVGQFATMAIDSSGTEYIAYYDAAWGTLKLATGKAGSYSISTVDSSANVGQWPSILLGGDGSLQIAYQDVTNQDLKLATGTPGSFSLQVVDAGEYVGADTRIFEFGDHPAILYFSGYENDLMLATFNGSAWTTEKKAGDEGALGFHNEQVTLNGKHYAACYDYTKRTPWFGALD